MVAHCITTDRLLLRRWSSADHAPFAGICADPEVMRHIGDGSVRTREQASAAIHRFEAAWNDLGYGLLAVELRGTGALIGFAGFSLPTFLPEILPSVEIGWRFAKTAWGRGLASEAATAALAFGRNAVGLDDIVCICQTGNGASRRIAQKIGLIPDRETIDPTCGRAVVVYRLPQEKSESRV